MRFQPKKWPDRFWAKVQKTEACWLWMGAVKSDDPLDCYGIIQMGDAHKSRTRLAHRIAWELEHGPIAAGVKILHRCDNPRCVRHDHLFAGTQADNIKDMTKKRRHPWSQGKSFNRWK